MTKGEYRVGITFNPSADNTVGQIKRKAADLIDLIDGLPTSGTVDEIGRAAEVMRLKRLALDAIEDGAMWAVKAATKPPMEE